jgi:cytochrome b subunit of formate dehydrogenase
MLRVNSMEEPPNQSSQEQPAVSTSFTRFDISQRIEHIIMLFSFTLLAITGLPQKFPTAPISVGIINAFGGIETTRLIHHINAVILMIVSTYHFVAVLYRIMVLRKPITMLPIIEDFKHLFQDVQYYLGMRDRKAFYGRYNYAEKAEYFAVVWGTIVMAITGFMMWNPIATTRFLPGQIIPAAKAAHGGEAILAVLAIIIWHFYHVHFRTFNKSMFTGNLTKKEMEEEHPAELQLIDAGLAWQKPGEAVILKRQRRFFPIAVILVAVFNLFLYAFITIEQTAITTVPRGETVAIYVPMTPTPRPTPIPSATPELTPGVQLVSWDGTFEALFRNRCSTCHGFTSVGGLSLATYQQALEGGKSGPGIVPGDPDKSKIVQIQSAGGHPGQLTIDEIDMLIKWILDGAPEK